MANRRNVLIGLGGLVAAGGAALGTGAFTTVEAQRTVAIDTAGDASAFLGLTPARQGGDFVDDSGDTIIIDLDGGEGNNNTNASPNASGQGLNQNAVTTFRNLVTVTNNGTQAVNSLSLTMDHSGDSDNDMTDSELEDTFDFTVAEGGNRGMVGNGEDILSASQVSISNLGSGSSINFGIQIDLINGGNGSGDLPDGDYTLTIRAETSTTGNASA